MNKEKKLSFIERKADKVGLRKYGGKESVLYMMGSLFIEVVPHEPGEETILYYNGMEELRKQYGQEFQQSIR